MKVCLVSGHFAPMETGGAERAARRLAEQLAGSGWQVDVLTAWHRDESEVHRTGLTVHRIRCGPFFQEGGVPLPGLRRWPWRLLNAWNPVAYRKARTLLAGERPRLVNVHNYAALSPAVFAAARSLAIPVVFTVHDYFPLCRHYSFEKRGRPCRGHCPACRLWSRWNRRCLGSAPVVFLSRHSRAVYGRHGIGAASLVWPNPVDLSDGEIAAARAEKETLRGRYPEAPVTWLFLGRLDALKGIAAVMGAWERLAPPRPRLRIAGDGPLAATVRAWAAGRPEVEVLGRVDGDAKRRELVAADGLLLPSRETDVSPLVAPEALGHGTPVLGADRGAVPELVEHGVTGWLCDTDDADRFSRLLGALSREPRGLRAMSAGCFAAARGRTFAASLPRLTAFLEEAAATAPRPR